MTYSFLCPAAQITEALVHLHFSARLIHRGICPQSVIVNKRGAWKLAGMEFVERCSDGDIMVRVHGVHYSPVPLLVCPDNPVSKWRPGQRNLLELGARLITHPLIPAVLLPFRVHASSIHLFLIHDDDLLIGDLDSDAP